MLKNLGKISLLRMSFNKSEGYSLASSSRVLKPSDKKKIFFRRAIGLPAKES